MDFKDKTIFSKNYVANFSNFLVEELCGFLLGLYWKKVSARNS